MSDTYTPKLSIDLDKELYDRYTAAIPWGLRNKIITRLLDELVLLIEHEGEIVLAAIIAKAISVRHILPEVQEKGSDLE